MLTLVAVSTTPAGKRSLPSPYKSVFRRASYLFSIRDRLIGLRTREAKPSVKHKPITFSPVDHKTCGTSVNKAAGFKLDDTSLISGRDKVFFLRHCVTGSRMRLRHDDSPLFEIFGLSLILKLFRKCSAY
jgi:hypothetical protein